MDIFLFILMNNIFPIFILISLGFLLSKKFNLDIYTISKLNFYIFVPTFTFVNLYTTDIELKLLKVIIFAISLLIVNFILSKIITKFKKYDSKLGNAFTNSILFYNSGNIGIPIISLVFSNYPFIINGETPYLNTALAIQIMVLLTQNITTNSIGFFNAAKANMHWKDSIKKIRAMPTLYAIPTAFLLKLIPFDFSTTPIWPALSYIKGGLVPIALIALGVQLSKTKFDFKNKEVYLSVFIRLLGGPIIAFCLILLFGFEGIAAQTLMISSSVPTAVNTALIAVEYDNCSDFASQTVMISTLLSSITLVFVIYFARIAFPI
ncbi:AEC family transporter [Defluviitalea phaphyphila]|uniref:AEC family transporter n=1 Tax=Defluviitalea phaphyphila TaxID=1473580 RepID=UPI00073166F6|nr:AEC family transporter [Defluviitalea phaphyphila]